MNVSVVRCIYHLLELRAKADGIVDDSNPGSLFALPEFYRAYWSVFGKELQLFALDVRDGQQVAGVVPLVAVGSDGSTGRRLRLELLGANVCDFSYFPGCENPAVLQAVLDFLWKQRRRWAVVRFPFVRDGSCLNAWADTAAREVGMGVLAIPSDVNHTLDLKAGTAGETPTWAPNKTMRKKINRLKQVSDLELKVHSDPQSVIQRLPHLMHLHLVRWSGTDTPSKFRFGHHREWYHRMTTELGPDRIVLFELCWDGRSIAYIFGFKQARRYLLYTAAIDISLPQYSPGALLNYMIVSHLAETGSCETVDLMRGDESYKLLLGTTAAPLWEIRWYSQKSAWLRRRSHLVARRLAKQALMPIPGIPRLVGRIRAYRQSTDRLRAGERKVLGSSDHGGVAMHRVLLTSDVSRSAQDPSLQWVSLTEGDWPKLKSYLGESDHSRTHGVLQKLWQNHWCGTSLVVSGNVMAFGMYKVWYDTENGSRDHDPKSGKVVYLLSPVVSPIWSDVESERRILRSMVEYARHETDCREVVLLIIRRQETFAAIEQDASQFPPAGREYIHEECHSEGLTFLSLQP